MAVLACALCHVRISFASDSAVVTLTQNGISTNYSDLATAIGAITADADLLVHADCSLGAELSVVNRKVTVHADELGVVITPISEDFQKAKNTSFEIGSGGELVLSNVVFRGFERFANAGTLNAVFVRVMNGGTFRMQNGARLENIDNAYGYYGAIKGDEGSKTILENGSALVGCLANGGSGQGGAIFLSSGAQLDLCGGVISNCVANKYGGGICAAADARIFISGPSVVWGNVQKTSSSLSGKQENIYVSGAPNTPVFTINSSVEGGKLGVGYSNDPRNKEGGVVATFAEGLSDEEKAASAAAFFSDANGDWYNGVVGAVSADGKNLVWGPTNREQGTVPEEEGTIVVDRAGKLLYFTDITAAFARLTGGVARVTLKADVVVTNGISGTSTTTGMSDNVDIWNIPICGEVTLDGAGHTIGRGGNYRFLVTGGENSLMVTNVTLKGETLQGVKAGDCSFLRAENGGLIVLEAGAIIRNVVCADWRLRTSAAVSVFNAAKLVMRDGADIACCTNAYNDKSAGGGVIVTSTNSVFRFEGGTIRNCSAVQGGGVQIDNSATIIITGSGKIMDNAGGNVCVADQSYLVLGDVFSGSIGHTAGVTMDKTAPAVFGRVADNCPVPAEELVSSAANFYRDADSSIRGCIVTNDTAKLLVWSNAITNGVYVDTKNSGVRYYAVESSEPPDDPPEEPVEEQEWSVETNYPTPIAFQSILQIDEKTWQLVMTNREPYCRYRLIYTDDLKKGFIHTDKWEKVLSEVDPVWTTNIVCEGTAWFWRAEGTFGTNMILKVETPEP